MTARERIHQKICENREKAEAWLSEKKSLIQVPFYSSVDVRDSSYKIASVDTNVYPAGFNNICRVDKEQAPELVREYILAYYGGSIKKIALLAEEHTNNAFYWENIHWIEKMLKEAGYETRICLPRDIHQAIEIQSSGGNKIFISCFHREADLLVSDEGFRPDLIISNNDFSNSYNEWISGLKTPINPPHALGWYNRKKSDHFIYYNQLASELAKLIGVDEWDLTVATEIVPHFDVKDSESRECVAQQVDHMLMQIQKEYQKRGITHKPVVFIKNNSGTYGLGVMAVHSGQDILSMNSKTRGKMNAAKDGGRETKEFILQEGIPTALMEDGAVAEPAVYIIGCELAGGFFRTHKEKSADESLNSPGAVYKKMCVSDLKISEHGHPIENVYGWVARLASLAVGYEIQKLGLKVALNPNFNGCYYKK